MAEGQALLDPIFIGRVDPGRPAERSPSLRILGLQQVPLAGAWAQDFTAGRDFETLGRGFLGFDAFWSSHKIAKFL